MGYQTHKRKAPSRVNCAVLTISDSRTEQDDESGKLLKEKLSQSGHQVMSYSILKNDANAIRQEIDQLLRQEELQIIITSGGTGIGHHDVTVDTLSPLFEKKLDGFGELFRFLSYQEIGSASMMSRAVAGVLKGKVILCLPGSVEAARLAIEKIILPELGHLVWEVSR